MPNFVTREGNLQFAEILEQLCIKLQITETQFKQAHQHYGAVGEVLNNGAKLAKYHPHIYPQGSLNLDTTVKPKGQNEFDLDAVCKLYIAGKPDPQAVYDLVWNCMYADKTYRDMIEPMPRCVRVTYANEFHMDIVPAIPDGDDEDRIFIPDIPSPKLKYWRSSNPRAYARWFETRTQTLVKLAEKRIDPLRRPQPVHLKATLKRSVQLFKRWRDIRFDGKMNLSPPSIILTTLAAELHGGEEWCTDALATILTKIRRTIRYAKKLKLYNPVNRDECISERWEKSDDAYDALVEGIDDFQERWLDLIHSHGLPAICKELESLFGETAVHAFREVTKPVNAARLACGLYVTKGTRTLTEDAGPSSYRVQPNSFYGDSET